MFREYRAIEHILDILYTLHLAGGVNDITAIRRLAKEKLGKDMPGEYGTKSLRKLVKLNILKSSPMGYELADDTSKLSLGTVMRLYALSTEDQPLHKLESLIFKKLDPVSLKDYFDNAG